eukprot:gene6202-6838_t
MPGMPSENTYGSNSGSSFPDQRPPIKKRTFRSQVIDNLITELLPLFQDEDLATLFQNTLPNTLDTTIFYHSSTPPLDSFVITGDIPALWLRDSMNQILPYIPYAANDSHLAALIEGLIFRHAHSVLLDPYANAFNFNASGEGHQDDSRTPPMTPAVFEGKYEVDSLNAFIKLSYWYYRYHPQGFAEVVKSSETFLLAMQQLLNTIATMQRDTGRLATPPYLFSRLTTVATDTLSVQERGPPCRPQGLTRSLFRPSDDAVTFPYNIPGNAMTCVEIIHLTELLTQIRSSAFPVSEENKSFATRLLQDVEAIRISLCQAMDNYTHRKRVIPYEVDGFGSEVYMDDANLPSLLSLPLTGYISTKHEAYQLTRSFVLSADNPYYYSGVMGKGVGGPHEGVNLTWPMAIIVQAMTSDDDNEIATCLNMLKTTTAETGLMHEAFNVDDPNQFTRSWFAWANGLFGELILQLIVTKPTLILKNDQEVISKAQELVMKPISLASQEEADSLLMRVTNKLK